jgi:hypothetical protein
MMAEMSQHKERQGSDKKGTRFVYLIGYYFVDGIVLSGVFIFLVLALDRRF